MADISRLAIVLLNWNSYDITTKCIDYFFSQRKDWNIIVVDNGSKDGSGEKLYKKYPDIIYLPQEKNIGFGGGNNAGIKKALEGGFEYIYVFNNDAFAEPGSTELLLEELERAGSPHSVAGPKILNMDGTLQWTGQNATSAGPQGIEDGDLSPRECDFIWGTAHLAHRRVFETIGGFDPDFFPAYAEDDDLCFRIRHAGMKLLYVPRAKVKHMDGTSTSSIESSKLLSIKARNNLLMRWLNYPKSWILKSTIHDLSNFFKNGKARASLANAYIENAAMLRRTLFKRRMRFRGNYKIQL